MHVLYSSSIMYRQMLHHKRPVCAVQGASGEKMCRLCVYCAVAATDGPVYSLAHKVEPHEGQALMPDNTFRLDGQTIAISTEHGNSFS